MKTKEPEPPAGEGEARPCKYAESPVPRMWCSEHGETQSGWCLNRLAEQRDHEVAAAVAVTERDAQALLASEREGLASAKAERAARRLKGNLLELAEVQLDEARARVEALERELREARDGLVLGQKVRAEMAGKMERERAAHQEALAEAAAADLSAEFKEKVKDVLPIDAAQLGYSMAIMRWQAALQQADKVGDGANHD